MTAKLTDFAVNYKISESGNLTNKPPPAKAGAVIWRLKVALRLKPDSVRLKVS